ncbi:MAG TPA: hypothetical protein VG474_01400 [Solirubrobacteraceae bacterium]|nr:hypothetical protein [Solirubrobacteraceae bacterium]
MSLTRRSPLLTVLALVAASVALAATVGVQAALGAGYRKCGLSEGQQQPRGGVPTYNISLKARSTSCSTARKVMRAFHSCRGKSGVRCTRKVLRRWRCSGRNTSSIATEFNGTYTCKSGRRRVRGVYQQRT